MDKLTKITDKKTKIQIKGKIICGKVWVVANDITEILGYESGRDAVQRHVSEKNKIKYPLVDGKNGKQINMINHLGVLEIFNKTTKFKNSDERREKINIVEGILGYFLKLREYAEEEERLYKELFPEEPKEIKKTFWEKVIGIFGF